VTRQEYTRYTWRAAPEAEPAVPPGEGPAGPVAGAALDYPHAEAVALLRSLQPGGWLEEDEGDTLTFWLPHSAEAGDDVAPALRGLGALGRLEVSRERPGWEDAWRRFHRPHVIGRLYLRPPWYPPHDDLLDVVVEAGMAFGTGGHASTRQCLREIQSIPPGALLDLGSGSGVVSFAALRLGFGPVWGIDIDPVAVQAAAGNAARNGLSPTFLVGDATDPAYRLPSAATVVANIALGPILRLAERWGAGAAAAAPPQHVLLAGLLRDQGGRAAEAYPAYRVTARRADGDWLLLHLELA
jgi:ribosomal protein L11 methyltransferase